MADLTVIISGAGAAGSAIARLILSLVKEVILIDSQGIISKNRSNLDKNKQDLAKITNKSKRSGTLQDALKGADVFIGVSKAGILQSKDIKLMNPNPIIFAMANPVPEIMPEEAKKAGAFIIATGRSDFPNQINNSLAFPGIFKGALESKATKITEKMKVKAALALASLVKHPTTEKIIPGPFEKGIAATVAKAIKQA